MTPPWWNVAMMAALGGIGIYSMLYNGMFGSDGRVRKAKKCL
jgi:hypothetical protein